MPSGKLFMGRTIEALMHTMRNAPDKTPPVSRRTDLLDEAQEVPFVEVGGPNHAMDGSPSVLAAAMRQNGARPVLSNGAVKSQMDESIAFQAFPHLTAVLSPARDRFIPELIAYHRPNHKVSDEYRSLLTAILQQAPMGGSEVILLTGASSRTGTSTAALNLAITRAREGPGRVVVVDAQCRRPVVAEWLGLPQSPGLREVLAGDWPLARVIRDTGQQNLYALPFGAAKGSMGHPGDALRPLLLALRRQFEFVIVDGPSWDDGPESAALAGGCDATYLVVRKAETGSPRVNELVRLMPHLGSYVAGLIVTRT
jgi:Mrp family chromosome partitioning ATPase